jgi:hypothetical protein
MQNGEDTPLRAAQRLIQSRYGPRGERSTPRTQDAQQHTDQDTPDDARASTLIIQHYHTQRKA